MSYDAAAVKRYHQKVRRAVIAKYGDKCVCCGETEFGFLTLDHINGGGAEHRRQLNKSNRQSNNALYRFARDNDCFNDLQVLCYNCNCAKQYTGECPHKRNKKGL